MYKVNLINKKVNFKLHKCLGVANKLLHQSIVVVFSENMSLTQFKG